MGRDYSVSHAAVLAAQLPPHSRCAITLNPDAAWTQERALLEVIDYHLRHLMWMFSKDGSQNRNAPKPPVSPSAQKRKEDQAKEEKRSREKVDRVLSARHPDLIWR